MSASHVLLELATAALAVLARNSSHPPTPLPTGMQVRLWDASSLRPVGAVDLGAVVNGLAVSEDSEILAVAGDDAAVRLLQLSTGLILGTFLLQSVAGHPTTDMLQQNMRSVPWPCRLTSHHLSYVWVLRQLSEQGSLLIGGQYHYCHDVMAARQMAMSFLPC